MYCSQVAFGRSTGDELGRDVDEAHNHAVSQSARDGNRGGAAVPPIDAAVLMGGCDKTVPAMIMGAISADIPAIFFPAGPMLKARWKNETLGSGSDAWKYWAERCAGNLCDSDWTDIENCIARSAGTCMTMGTASTMACIAETLGFTCPVPVPFPRSSPNTRAWL